MRSAPKPLRRRKRPKPPKPENRSRPFRQGGAPAIDVHDLPPAPPQRRITASTEPRRQPGKQGVLAVSTLECGHELETRRGDRQRGWCFCFQCQKRGRKAERRSPDGPAHNS
jgi:hypothetical protein